MAILKVTKNTIFKAKPIQSAQLSGTDKVSVSPQSLPIRDYSLENRHYFVTLESPLWKRTQWYVFEEHAEIDQGGSGAQLPLTLAVRSQSVFKAKLALADALADSEKTNALVGEYELKSYEDVGNHLKVELAQPIDGRTEWYIFEGHVEVLNVPDYPPPEDETTFSMPKVVIKVPTTLKVKPVDSTALPDTEKLAVTPGMFVLTAVTQEGRHFKVTLKQSVGGRSTWYVFGEHAELRNAEDLLQPAPEPPAPPPPVDRGRLINIPGYGTVGTLESIIPNGNFYWGEATKDGSRIPENATIARNIVRMAERMEEVRSRLGNRAISITSWYRPPAVNRAVGGASNSTHMQGYAVDFVVSGLSPRSVQRILDPWWPGGLGYGSTFTHLDDRGYRARWNYGN